MTNAYENMKASFCWLFFSSFIGDNRNIDEVINLDNRI